MYCDKCALCTLHTLCTLHSYVDWAQTTLCGSGLQAATTGCQKLTQSGCNASVPGNPRQPKFEVDCSSTNTTLELVRAPITRTGTQSPIQNSKDVTAKAGRLRHDSINPASMGTSSSSQLGGPLSPEAPAAVPWARTRS